MTEWFKIISENHPEAAAIIVGMTIVIGALSSVVVFLYIEKRRSDARLLEATEKHGDDLMEVVVTNGTRIEQMRQTVENTNNIILNKLS